MSSNVKKALLMVLALIAALWAVKLVIGLAIGVVLSLMPLAIVAGIIYFAYVTFGRKALGGGRRTLP